jgi:hypothetical protein
VLAFDTCLEFRTNHHNLHRHPHSFLIIHHGSSLLSLQSHWSTGKSLWNAEMEGCDVFDKNPIFSWLSPQQRIHMVREVAVGLLCPQVPLPPDTFHHFATYLAVFTCIDAELQMEINDFDPDCVGADLLDQIHRHHHHRLRQCRNEHNKK